MPASEAATQPPNNRGSGRGSPGETWRTQTRVSSAPTLLTEAAVGRGRRGAEDPGGPAMSPLG